MKRRSFVGGLLALVGLGGAAKARPSALSQTVLTRDNTFRSGKPCRIYDADGEEVEMFVRANLQTGEVESYAPTATSFCISHNVNEMWVFKDYRPAPLRVEWYPLRVEWITKK